MKQTFEVLKAHSLFVKHSKCSFGKAEVDYRGHIITQQRVNADLDKIRVMMEGPVPITIKELRSFLGLTGYYRIFVIGYGLLVRPLRRTCWMVSFNN